MGKKPDKRDEEDRARRKLAKAQLEMQIAQEKRRQVMTKGEHLVEQARLRAAKSLEKATRRVERSAAAVAQAEARVVRASPPTSTSSAGTRLEVRPAGQRQASEPAATETMGARPFTKPQDDGERDKPEDSPLP